MTWNVESLELLEAATMPTPDLDVAQDEAEHVGLLNGQIVQVKCTGGYVMEVDPKTRTTTERRQEFKIRYV